MAYRVQFRVPSRSLGKADVEFKVRSDSHLMGTLMVSKGSLVWFPRGYLYGCRIEWNDFDEFMRKYAAEQEKR